MQSRKICFGTSIAKYGYGVLLLISKGNNMEVTNISNKGGNYDPFLVDALKIKDPKATKTNDKTISDKLTEAERTEWRMSILADAIGSLENNIQVQNDGSLFDEANAPIETYAEALKELMLLLNNDFDKYAKDAQANLTPADIVYLFEDQISLKA